MARSIRSDGINVPDFADFFPIPLLFEWLPPRSEPLRARSADQLGAFFLVVRHEGLGQPNVLLELV